MSGRLAALIVVLAIFAAAEPLLHSHPLAGASAPCAACASEARILTAPPALAAPRATLYILAAATLTAFPFRSSLALPARAPPIA
jgi:hypothetical protein